MAAKEIALGVAIGGVVSATFGKSMNVVSKSIDDLRKKGDNAKIWKGVVAETIKLQKEFRAAHMSGSSAADGIRRKIESNFSVLKSHGLAVDNLALSYKKLDQVVRGIDLQIKGREMIDQGRAQIGDAIKYGAIAAVPTKIAADYQAIIRDTAIKANIANTGEERDMAHNVRQSASKTGIGRDVLAGAINQLVSGGMNAKEAVGYSDLIGTFSIGQGVSPEDTAKLIASISANANITDPEGMKKALESIAYQGQEGNFEAEDMAKTFPTLLAEMKKIGITGQGSINQLGAMLQVQRRNSGSSDEAATNLKNWFSKIGSNETLTRYKKAGIDYEKSMQEAIAKGVSPLEASLGIAAKYIETSDPKKGKQMEGLLNSISNAANPEEAQEQIKAFEALMKTSDIFNDMQVKAALTAYLQNKEIYKKLKKEGAEANGILEKNLQERQEISRQKWSEVGNAINNVIETIGDAIRPVTDLAASAVIGIANFTNGLLKLSPAITTTAASIGAAIVAFKGMAGVLKVLRGAYSIGKGSILAGRGILGDAGGGQSGGKGGGILGKATSALGGVQNVFVTNMPAGGFGGDDFGGGGRGKGRGRFGRGMGRGIGRIGGVIGAAAPYAAKAGGALSAVGAAYQTYDTFQNAETADEKAEGYGGAAGTLAGGIAGAKVGAMAGAMAGPIGIAIGGVAGGLIGSIAGSSIGSWIGKKLFGDDEDEQVAQATPQPSEDDARPPQIVEALAPPSPAAAQNTAYATAQQQMTFAPSLQITVQGDVKDPKELARSLMPELRRLFDDYQKQQARGAMYDAAHPW